MRKTELLITASLFVVATNLAWADTGCDPSLGDVAQSACDTCATCGESALGDCRDCSCGRWYLFPQHQNGFKVHGWIDGGFIGNTSSPNSKFNGPYNAVDRSNEAMLNQLYLVAEKDLPSCGHGLGGRVDVLYGEDFFLAESIGME